MRAAGIGPIVLTSGDLPACNVATRAVHALESAEGGVMSSMTTPLVGPQHAGALASQMRRLLLVGLPGAGKSSQGTCLAARLGVPHVSTGALLREEVRRGGPVGRQASEYMRAGELVPDWLVPFILEHQLSNALEVGFVLDGYPSTLEQAERFMRSLGRAPLDRVIELAVSDDASTMRHARCGSELQRRSDDDEHVVRARLVTHREQTEPMLEHFAAAGLLGTIDGNRPKGVVASELLRLVACQLPMFVETST